MSQTQNEINDTDADYWLTKLTKRAEISLSPNEKRGRYLAEQAMMEETQMHPVAPSDEYGFWLCLGSLAMATLAVLLLLLVVLHRVYVPDAIIWPMGVASLICAGGCAVTGWFGVRGLA